MSNVTGVERSVIDRARRVEQALRRLFEDGPLGLMRPRVQPARLAHVAATAMLRRTTVDSAGVIAANRIVLRLSPVDFEPFRPWLATLERRIERRLARVASDHGVRPAGSIRVTILGDPAIKRGIVAEATIGTEDGAIRGRAAPTRRFATSTVWTLIGDDRSRIHVATGTSTVGRADDNVVVLGDSRVSRYHARLSLVADRLSVHDLGSTNGTLVNHREIASAELRRGDNVSFGGLEFRVERA